MTDEQAEVERSKVALFKLRFVRGGTGGTVMDVLECPIGLMIDHINPETTLLTVPYGSDFTVEPMEPTAAGAIKELNRVFRLLDQPCKFHYELQQRQDALVQAVAEMLGTIEVTVVEDEEDLRRVVARLQGKDDKYARKVAKRRVLGEQAAFLDQEDIKIYKKRLKELEALRPDGYVPDQPDQEDE